MSLDVSNTPGNELRIFVTNDSTASSSANTALTPPESLPRQWLGRKISLLGFGGLLISTVTGGVFCIYGFATQNYFLFGFGLSTAFFSSSGACCLYKNIPDKEFENRVKDLTNQYKNTDEIIAKLQEQVTLLNQQIVDLKNNLEAANNQIATLKKLFSDATTDLERVTNELLATKEALSKLSVLHNNYQETTHQIVNAVKELDNLNPKLHEKFDQISSIIKKIGANGENFKTELEEVGKQNKNIAEMLNEASKIEQNLDGLREAIQILIPIIKETNDEKRRLATEIESLQGEKESLLQISKSFKENTISEENFKKALEAAVTKLQEINKLKKGAL